MNVVVIYEPISKGSHAIADAIGVGLMDGNEVNVAPADRVSAEAVGGVNLIVVGGPTHRDSPGLTEWFASLATAGLFAAAFDTRPVGVAALTGRASLGIEWQLRRYGFSVLDPPHSFLVDDDDELRPGETARARLWGRQLALRLREVVSVHAG